MPKVKYVGDPNDDFSGPSTLRAHGHDFKKGELVEVPDSVAAKLAGHSHFRKEGEDPEQTENSPLSVAARMEPDELRDLLDQAGVEYAKNLGRAKLAQLLVNSGWTPGEADEE